MLAESLLAALIGLVLLGSRFARTGGGGAGFHLGWALCLILLIIGQPELAADLVERLVKHVLDAFESVVDAIRQLSS